jgi:thiosulfate dehydrogenase [quinone] large subunit
VLGPWSSAGYLQVANGPFAEVFHRMAASSWLPTIDHAVSIALLLVGLSLLLGLFTQAGCVGALALLAMFYVSFLPTSGLHETGSEGAYLIVNKNLVEAAAVLAVFAFRTGRIAGLDLLRRRPAARPRVEEAA